RAEAWAVLWLRLKGYRILARNFRVPVGEIDVIARAATWFVAADRRAAERDWRFDLMVIRPWRRPRHLVDAWRPSAARPSDCRAV
ncbi:MAG: YraN family protein, partial [Pseudomonadota bacterium]|nr:YraN family protein [Pseudomonadota bacterium]